MAAGCAARVQTEARASASAGEADDRRWELGPTGEPAAAPDKTASVAPAASTPSRDVPTHFLGVVHDLSLAPAAGRVAACSCLALAYGPPDDPKFVWQARPYAVDRSTMAIAVQSEGIACSLPAGTKRPAAPASIAAVEQQGPDVVVVVEAATRGRPVARGALVKRPEQGGGITVRGRGGVPFGTPLGGGRGACRIPVG